MKKSRFTEAQFVVILKEADAGMKVADIYHKHGITDATYYNWKSKDGGMEASDLKRMRIEGRVVAAQAHVYRAGARERCDVGADHKNALRPPERRVAVKYLRGCHARHITGSRWAGWFGSSRLSRP